MDRLQSLQIFVRVVENGSFSVTAKEFSLGQASVSKQVSELEHHLETKLLARTTRRLNITEAGEKFYQRAKTILEQYNFAVGEAKNLKQKPSGTLRLASPILFGRKYITPLLSRFIELYPDVIIEHYLSDTFTDLVQEGIDVSIRMGEMDDSTHQARKMATFKYVTVASKEFIKRHGSPKHPKDLEKLPCLIYLGIQTPFKWEYSDKSGGIISVKANGVYRTNAAEAMREAVIAGIGILRGPTSTVAEELKSGKLIKLLPDYDSEVFPVYAVTPASAYVPQKTRAMIDFLHKEFKVNSLLSE